MANENNEKIIGVDRDILVGFLELIRDRYGVADEANFFLEVNTGESGINIGITNQRDVLSHLVTLLKECNNKTNFSLDEQRAQLNNAEEHFRRAIIEPYEYAVDLKIDEFAGVYRRFQWQSHIPLASYCVSGLPATESIISRFTAIKKKRTDARAAKRENSWSATWEAGVKKIIDAYTDIDKLIGEINDYNSKLFGFIIAVVFLTIATAISIGLALIFT